MNKDILVRIDGVKKSYGKGEAHVDVLKGISCEIAKGEKCVLFGPSGSGKSTVLNLLGGLESVDSGSIAVENKRLEELSQKQIVEYRRESLGFIFQFYNLIQDLTIRENIEVGANISADPLDVDELIESLGLWEQRNKFPRQVSGGQQQRCAVGRALVKNPKLLLCDEPTGALDYKTSKEILGLLDNINSQFSSTMLIVTHNEAIRDMCDHVLSLRDGVFTEDYRNENVVPAAQITW